MSTLSDRKKSVLIHAADHKMLQANVLHKDPTRMARLTEDEQEIVKNSMSNELHYITDACIENGWSVFWCTLEDTDIEMLHFASVYDVINGEYLSLTNAELNNRIDVVLARVLGSIEGKLSTVKRYFEKLRESFEGITINDPTSAIYGLRKDYLFELAGAGYPTIATDYFENTVTFSELEQKYRGSMDLHLVKPVTGELSNSLRVLGETDEKFFRHKESLVGGWLVQPVMSEIWQGEYQLFFLGDSCTYANKKIYHQDPEHPVIPSQKNRLIHPYVPQEDELALARHIKAFWRDHLHLETDIFRLDFIKTANGSPIIVEFETVNPGFFIKYIDDERRKKIATDFEVFLTQRLENRQ